MRLDEKVGRAAVIQGGVSLGPRLTICTAAAIPLLSCIYAAINDPGAGQKSGYWVAMGLGLVGAIVVSLWISWFHIEIFEDGFAYTRLFGGTSRFQFSEIRRGYFTSDYSKGTKYARFNIELVDGAAVGMNVSVFPWPVIGRLMAGLEGHGIPIEGVSFPQARSIMARARRYYPAAGPGAARAGTATGAGTRTK